MYLAHPTGVFENTDGAAFEIAKTIGGDLFFGVVLTGIIIAHFAAGLSFQASVGRLLYALGRDNQLPQKLFGVLHPRYKTPVFNIMLSGAFGLVGFGLTIATATSLVNFGAFLAFTAVNLCALKLTFDGQVGDKVGVLRGVLFPLAGAFTSGWMLISLDQDALILGGCWVLLGPAGPGVPGLPHPPVQSRGAGTGALTPSSKPLCNRSLIRMKGRLRLFQGGDPTDLQENPCKPAY